MVGSSIMSPSKFGKIVMHLMLLPGSDDVNDFNNFFCEKFYCHV
jgi:hypothetical protein